MKSARERALEITRRGVGLSVSTELFRTLVTDDSELGRTVRNWVEVIERGIEQDRLEIEKARLPS